MTALAEPPPAASLSTPDVAALVARQRAHFERERARPVAARRERLQHLLEALLAERDSMRAAMQKDFHRAAQEIHLTEHAVVVIELRDSIRNLSRWSRPRRVPTPLPLFGTRSEIRCEPKGVALIIAPWNYPVQLALIPLISAVAAGNCVVLKPSECTPNTARWLHDFLGRIFPPEEVVVVEGDAAVSTELLRQKFDHIFFTGSPAVGKIVAHAAAEQLTPVTLELGGKSPNIIHESADLPRAARVTAWGKWVNSGQTCIAPDYVLVQRSVHDQFVTSLKQTLLEFFGPTGPGQTRSPDLAQIVSERHFDRVLHLVEDATKRGARIACGGEAIRAERFLAPTVLIDVPLDAKVLHEEIFGPVLPIVPYDSLDEALAFIRARENPLVLYAFCRDNAALERIISGTSAGGMSVNDTLMQYMNPYLPFGGAGYSGIGRAHGEAGFRTFSNELSILHRKFDGPIRHWMFPPLTAKAQRLIDWIVKWLS